MNNLKREPEKSIDNNIVNINVAENMHDSTKEISLNYIKNTGEYNLYLNCLCDAKAL